MDDEDLDEFVYEFHERVLGIEPEQNERPEWDWIRRKQNHDSKQTQILIKIPLKNYNNNAKGTQKSLSM